jgi:hypothetical protein
MSNLARSAKLHTKPVSLKTSCGYNILDYHSVVTISACYFCFIHNHFVDAKLIKSYNIWKHFMI